MLVVPFCAFGASMNQPHALSNELVVETSPTYPQPYEDVQISLSLYTGDLNSANITWYEDGKEVLSGKGEKVFNFKTSGAGKETNIDIYITMLDGISFSKSISINPASIDLVWEAQTYTPPFFKGKAMHSPQGLVKIVAIPEFVRNGQRVSSSNLVYKWTKGTDVLESNSGYGKDSVLVSGSLFGRTDEIQVIATDPVSGSSAATIIYISPTNPEIIFYQNDPYYGHIFDTAVSNTLDLKSEEVEIVAAPFYFSKESGSGLRYEWRLNNQIISSLYGSMTAIFKRPEGESGSSAISLRIENQNKVLQQANESLIIKFKN